MILLLKKYVLKDKLMEIFIENMNRVNIEVILRVYCILVNSLSKTTSPKFEKVKLRLKEWISLLKEIFIKFAKNDIHENYTFIFAHRCKKGFYDSYYELKWRKIFTRN